ncbi:MAG: hypothetical protein AB1324_01605 [Candidatus Micrarchaeota archaeon]
MAEEFGDFLKKYLDAVRNGDKAFMAGVYSEWFDTSGFPKEQKEQFFHAIFEDLKQVIAGAPEEPECFGDFCIAHFRDAEGEGRFSLTFRRKGESWEYFNERSGFSKFSKVYSIQYVVEGEERLGILFNGKKSPVLIDIGSSGFASLINAALVPGDNEITLLPPASGSARVSIRISSGRQGDIVNSAQGDVLSWDGVVKGPAKLNFRAE